ncbi:MAG: Peptide chain release factor 2 [Candidatus Anoxychlamydiales bacterium]|nr:Peptide chain release factor 2 [Candidatus Anoxychlamydiales bacterium]
MEETNFWDDPNHAQKIVKQSNVLKAWTVPYFDLKKRYSYLSEFFIEADKEKDDSLKQDLYKELDLLEKDLEDLEVKKMLAHELDSKSCYLSINAGAGGTESCDWVLILSRMYERYATKKKWKVSVIDKVDGDVAGIKSITYQFEGDFAYGYTKSEKGVHRLVRISPFDANKKRHTSFASVDVSPIIDDNIEIEVGPDDIRVDTFRASGAGGQHINTTDSAVRMVHIPTNIIVSCQSERSQIQNRLTCMKMLKSKLYEQKVLEREAKLKEISGGKKEIAWGSQIRSYVFQPYKLVKDTRTKYETSNVDSVLNGELDEFVKAYLKDFG